MTHSDTIWKDGVRYSTYPPPFELLKVMKRCWAEKFVTVGSMRFGNLDGYRRWENPVLGDPNDGNGMFRMKGHPYTVGSSNHVYAWCASHPEITRQRLLKLANYGGYDCLVRISEPKTLIQRIRTALLSSGKKLQLHCAAVSYIRGSEVNKATLNSQKFHFNVFQKAPRFSEDCEYRISLTDVEILSPLRSILNSKSEIAPIF